MFSLRYLSLSSPVPFVIFVPITQNVSGASRSQPHHLIDVASFMQLLLLFIWLLSANRLNNINKCFRWLRWCKMLIAISRYIESCCLSRNFNKKNFVSINRAREKMFFPLHLHVDNTIFCRSLPQHDFQRASNLFNFINLILHRDTKLSITVALLMLKFIARWNVVVQKSIRFLLLLLLIVNAKYK